MKYLLVLLRGENHYKARKNRECKSHHSKEENSYKIHLNLVEEIAIGRSTSKMRKEFSGLKPIFV